MTDAADEAMRIRDLEARVEALSSVMKSMLTTFVIRGIMSKADIPALLESAGEMLQEGEGRARVWAELNAIGETLPGYQSQRMGPFDPNDHDH